MQGSAPRFFGPNDLRKNENTVRIEREHDVKIV